MNPNEELLNFIYQNAQMGVTTLEQLDGIVNDAPLRVHLQAQLREYRAIHDKAAALLEARGCDEDGLSGYEKLKTYLMINLQTLTDRSPSHIAEMLILGSNMGLIDAIKKQQRYKLGAQADILALMRRLQRFEENNVERLKTYL